MYSASDMLDDDASLFGDQRVVSRSLRRHSALGYRPPAPEAVLWSDPNTTGLQSKMDEQARFWPEVLPTPKASQFVVPLTLLASNSQYANQERNRTGRAASRDECGPRPR